MRAPRQVEEADVWLYAQVARLHTPFVDRELRHLTHSADKGRLWFATAALLALFGGPAGRAAARDGVRALGLASAVTNIVLKPIGGRRRPDREAHRVPAARHVRMPGSTSFPSGHSASALAFSVAAARGLPRPVGLPIRALGLLIGYTRVHAGVHYPGDVLAGGAAGWLAASVVTRRRAGRS